MWHSIFGSLLQLQRTPRFDLLWIHERSCQVSTFLTMARPSSTCCRLQLLLIYTQIWELHSYKTDSDMLCLDATSRDEEDISRCSGVAAMHPTHGTVVNWPISFLRFHSSYTILCRLVHISNKYLSRTVVKMWHTSYIPVLQHGDPAFVIIPVASRLGFLAYVDAVFQNSSRSNRRLV